MYAHLNISDLPQEIKDRLASEKVIAIMGRFNTGRTLVLDALMNLKLEYVSRSGNFKPLNRLETHVRPRDIPEDIMRPDTLNVLDIDLPVSAFGLIDDILPRDSEVIFTGIVTTSFYMTKEDEVTALAKQAKVMEDFKGTIVEVISPGTFKVYGRKFTLPVTYPKGIDYPKSHIDDLAKVLLNVNEYSGTFTTVVANCIWRALNLPSHNSKVIRVGGMSRLVRYGELSQRDEFTADTIVQVDASYEHNHGHTVATVSILRDRHGQTMTVDLDLRDFDNLINMLELDHAVVIMSDLLE